MRRGRIGLALALLVATGLAASWIAGSLLVRTSHSTSPPARPPARDLTLVTADGVRIAATYWPGAKADATVILLLHGKRGSRAMLANNAAWFAERGHAAMTIDFRGHGESGDGPYGFGLTESHDAAAAIDWLRQKNRAAPIAAVGISLGGAAILLGDAGPLPVDALVLQGVYPEIRSAIRNRIASVVGEFPARLLEPLLSFQTVPRLGICPSRLSPLAAIPAYHGPVMLIAGAEDRYTLPTEIERLYRAAKGPKTFWVAPAVDHAALVALQSEEYRQHVLRFVEATVGTGDQMIR